MRYREFQAQVRKTVPNIDFSHRAVGPHMRQCYEKMGEQGLKGKQETAYIEGCAIGFLAGRAYVQFQSLDALGALSRFGGRKGSRSSRLDALGAE